MTPVVVGLVLGLAASLAVNRVLQSQLVGVSPYDALTLTLAPALLLAVALVGCLLPLRQAVRVDPVVALRNDVNVAAAARECGQIGTASTVCARGNGYRRDPRRRCGRGRALLPKSGWDDVAMGVNRRELLLVAGGVTIVALGAEGARRVWAQIAADVPPATALEARHVAIITKLANMILPTTETPGALDVGVPAWVAYVLSESFDSAERQSSSRWSRCNR